MLFFDLGRYGEADPLYRRCIEILRQSSRKMRRSHPNLEPAIGNYTSFLAAIGKNETEVEDKRQRLMRWEE